MEIMEIILLIAGGIIFILSFFIPDGKSASEGKKELPEEDKDKLTEQALAAVRGRTEQLVQEVAEEIMEKTELSLERLSNEKIMAVSEYSDTVLAEIHKNHEEAMFLYDMLNNKHTSIKNALGEINRAVKEAEEAKASIQKPSVEENRREDGGREKSVPWKNLSETTAVDGTESARLALQRGKVQNKPEADAAGLKGTETPQAPGGPERNNNVKILELYQQGMSIVNIAKELDLGVGEVKLVVDLFNRQ